MDMVAVSSSSIRRAGYDAAVQVLRIEFTNDRVYEYTSVPIAVYEALVSAPSIGAYFSRFVRPHYQARRIRTT